MEQLPGCFCMLRVGDEDAVLTKVNQCCRETFGYTAGDSLLYGLTDAERRQFFVRLREKIAGHESVDHRGRAVSPDGQSRWILLKGTWLADGERSADYLCNVADITDEMLRERQMEDIMAEMEHAQPGAGEEKLMEELRMEREMLRAVAIHSGRMVFKYDIAARTVYLGEEGARRFGVEPVIANLSEHTLRVDRVAKESRAEYLELFRAVARGEPAGTSLIRGQDETGRYAWYQADFTTIFDEDKPLYAIVTVEDVNDRYERELLYQEYQQRSAAVDARSYACCNLDLTRNRCDQEKGALLGRLSEHSDGTLEGMIQHAAELYVLPESEAQFRKFSNRVRLLHSYEKGSHEEQSELLLRVGDEEHWCLERAQMFEDPYSGDVRCILSITDIDREKRGMMALLQRADFDALTGLLNRAAFAERVDGQIAKGEGRHALLLMELDQFKNFNDSFGHVQGDRLLTAAAKLLTTVLRPTDILGRLGNDGFLIFLINIPNPGLALRRAELLCRLVREKLSRYGSGVTTSVGVALCPEDGRSFQALYEWADKGLCNVKAKGGNDCVWEKETGEKPAAAREAVAGRVFIRTFGRFDVFVDGEPLAFSSAKAKELMAVLVDRRGGILTSDEAIGLLWEDEPASKVTQTRYRKVALRLKNILDEARIGDMLVSRRDGRYVDVNCFACDYYQYLEGDEAARAMYHGSYMSNYSWAESTLAYLEFDNEK